MAWVTWVIGSGMVLIGIFDLSRDDDMISGSIDAAIVFVGLAMICFRIVRAHHKRMSQRNR